MRLRGITVMAGCWLLAGIVPSYASETGPVIVIPGRPGVPIIVNGQDISGAVIEGDWGLARPGQNEPRILYRYGNGALIGPSSRAGYFPTTGRAPLMGRREVDVARPTQGSETFFRSFNAQSDQTPVTPPQSMQQTPPIVVAPEQRRRHHP
jgi:hypothetical protein